MFRRTRLVLSALALSALTVTLSASAALKTVSPGTFTVHGTAAKKTINVDGNGQLTVKDDGTSIIFTSDIGKGAPHFDMGERQKHTRQHFGITGGSVLTLTIAKSALKLPEDGKTASGTADGKLKFASGSQNVKVHYTVKRD